MGVYIKGMEMPKHCMDCPFMVSRDGDDCILQSAEANENFESWEQMKAGCPLVPIPPHGRLIDADEMRDEWLINGENEYVYDTNAFLESIDNQPTVIPAEFGGAESK